MNVRLSFHHRDSSFSKQPEGLRKDRVFHFKNACGETLRRI